MKNGSEWKTFGAVFFVSLLSDSPHRDNKRADDTGDSAARFASSILRTRGLDFFLLPNRIQDRPYQ